MSRRSSRRSAGHLGRVVSRRTVAVGLAAVLLTAAGCTAGDKAAPQAAPIGPASVPASVPPSAPAGESRTFQAGPDRITMTITPLVRSAAAVVLTVPTRLEDSGPAGVTSTVTHHFNRSLTVPFDGARLVDESAGRAYEVARDGTGSGSCTCTQVVNLGPGERGTLQAAFTGVPATATKMTVLLPYAGVFLDVPVVDGPVPAPSPTVLHGQQQPPLELIGTSPAHDLVARTDRPAVALHRQQTPEQVEINLDADVLFRIDRSDLTPAATKSIAAAVADLRKAGAGPLGVTGHTDNTGTTAHNQALSQARARTVATALARALPEAQWPKTVAGKGESQPVASNSSTEGRRLNRRVTISYRTRAAGPGSPSERSAQPTATPPAATGVVGTAADGVQVAMGNHTLPADAQRVHITAGPAARRGDRLLVTLTIHNDGSDQNAVGDYLAESRAPEFLANRTRNFYDDSGVHLLDGDTVIYPLSYDVGEYQRECLCDPDLAETLPSGTDRMLPIWFPAPAAGAATTVVDVPGKFRLTDVPISGR